MAGVELLLVGKAALVTGGSRGIGAETVRLLRAAGARVAFSYREARVRAEALERELSGVRDQGSERQGTKERGSEGTNAGPSTSFGAKSAPNSAQDDGGNSDGGGKFDDGDDLIYCVGIEQELETPADGRALVEKAVRALGRLDILVVNHGVWPPEDAPIEAMADAQWRRTMGVNLDAGFGLVQAGVAAMLGQSGGKDAAGTAGQETGATAGHGGAAGHIVLISSTAGQRGEAFHADYAASKGALISLTKSLASELAPKGIRVNCVAPGWVDTEMAAGILKDPELGPRTLKAIPLGRAATPREIAGPVVFLCTPLAGFITGEVLNVNGGAVMVG